MNLKLIVAILVIVAVPMCASMRSKNNGISRRIRFARYTE